MNNIAIERLPFYWRLEHRSKRNKNIVDDYLPFSFGIDSSLGLIIQKRNVITLKALNKVYQQEYNIGYLQDTNHIAKPYGIDFIKFLKLVLNKNTFVKDILEIGCGGCVVLKDLQDDGYKVIGVDSSPFAFIEGKKKDIKVITDFFPTSKLTKKFDLIFHVDVLEHIDGYIAFLKHQYNSLNENGLLVVNVPDASESISIGDISMAMHQHLNYFTEKSLTTVLQSAGFEVLSVIKSGYGGSLYGLARRGKKIPEAYQSDLSGCNDYQKFPTLADRLVKKFINYTKPILLDKKKSLGFYVPLRTLPYLAKFEVFEGFRFFDDTTHWHNNVFDGIDVHIENFDDLKLKPVTDIIVMSLTFGEIIKNKIINQFGKTINVITLRELVN